jgi:two-component system cell cycle response regulator
MRDKRSVPERLSAILDTALFDSVVAGEIRALASTGTIEKIFDGLIAVVNDVMTYRWIALVPSQPDLSVQLHGHPGEHSDNAASLTSMLGVAPDRPIRFVLDERPIPGIGPAPESTSIFFAGAPIGRLVLAPTVRGLSTEDRRLLGLFAAELGGPVQMSILYEDARRLATIDALTQVLNRRAFLDTMERERSRSERHNLPISLLLLDVDHFKNVNDKYGHAAGDVILRGTAKTLVRVARKSDVVARWGGEEFVLALPQTGAAGARVAGERVRHSIAGTSHELPSGEIVQVTASIGIASATPPWVIDDLVSAADSAMYVAKNRGRNRVESGPSLIPIARNEESGEIADGEVLKLTWPAGNRRADDG